MSDGHPVRRAAQKIVACLGAVLSAAVLLPMVAAPAAAADPCPDVEVVFARGTAEPSGVGRVGQAFIDALNGQLGGRNVGVYAVNYPASYNFLNTATGATDATGHISWMAQVCPSTAIVLGGFSQGAAVVSMLIGVPPVWNRLGNIGSAPPLPADLAGNVAAVVAFGNPAARFGNPANTAPPPFGARAIDLCADGDPVCSQGRSRQAHSDYESGPLPAQAAGFVAGLL
jgi:cutinase